MKPILLAIWAIGKRNKLDELLQLYHAEGFDKLPINVQNYILQEDKLIM